MNDLHYATRMLRRGPALTVAVVLSLALGIGANTAIFSVMDVLMLRALPVREPERLVLIAMTRELVSTSYALFEKLRDEAANVADLSAIVHTNRYNVPISGEVRLKPDATGVTSGVAAIDSGPVRLALVSGEYFSMLGVGAAVGRVLSGADDRPSGGQQVVVISDAYWDRRFARAPDVIGRTLTMSGKAYAIVGVAQRGFSTFFGSLALLLACVGLYGVVSYAVARRTAEISVRLALGATRGRVLRTILQESLMLVAAGVGIGLPIALVLTRLVGARLFGVTPADPPRIAAAVALMMLVAAVASFFPARRAARIDPMVALRCD
jgi:ABC-type antimicrobial peptide transport system permease subunit